MQAHPRNMPVATINMSSLCCSRIRAPLQQPLQYLNLMLFNVLSSSRRPMMMCAIFLLLSSTFSYCSIGPVTVLATPITVPDLSACQPAIGTSPASPGTQQVLDCCLTPGKDGIVKEFFLEGHPVLQKKVRRPAHRVKAKYIEKYNRAYELMRALPKDDPRSFGRQANIHCAFCNGAYKQRGTNITLQVHFSWFFLPWHRWYLYFHERILASLVGDPRFALVYWNWDNQQDGGNSMPALFNVKGSALHDVNRNPSNLPPSLVRLRPAANKVLSVEDAVKENLNVMYQSVVTASTADMFMGGAYRAGIDFSNVTAIYAPLGGALELNAHAGIHYWTGDPKAELRGDMGVFTTAARDPIFYAHHSNVDRLWEVWQSIPGGRRTNPTDPDFLDAEFFFYDENANLVKVKARDALDNKKLGVVYKKAGTGDDEWLNFAPLPVSNGSQVEYARAHGVQEIKAASKSNPVTYQLGSNFSALVERPHAAKPKDGAEEVLLIQGLEVLREQYVHVQVFINLPQANASTPIYSAEYLGSANVVPTPQSSSIKHLKTNVMLEIGDNIRRIGLADDKWLVVSILVQSASPLSANGVTIQGMQILYQ